MDSIKLKLNEIIKSNKAIDSNDGENLNMLITKNISQNKKVILDFDGIISILSLFLNPAIGDLYGKFSEKEIKEHLIIENFLPEYNETLKRVVDRAKEFYKDEESVTRIIDQGMEKSNEGS